MGEAHMRRAGRKFLTGVFDVLGPECVRRGLEARGHQWGSCFIARAVGDLPDDALPAPTTTEGAGPFYGAWLGIAAGWVYELVYLWDRDEAGFRDVAREWLGRHTMDGEATPWRT